MYREGGLFTHDWVSMARKTKRLRTLLTRDWTGYSFRIPAKASARRLRRLSSHHSTEWSLLYSQYDNIEVPWPPCDSLATMRVQSAIDETIKLRVSSNKHVVSMPPLVILTTLAIMIGMLQAKPGST